MSLEGKEIVIIGGSSGFGLEIAAQAALQGARLIITGRDASKLEAALAALRERGAEVRGECLDVADHQALERFLASTGGYDHLVSMAGGFMGGGFLGAPEEVIRQAVEEKFFANLTVARAAAPGLRPGGSMVFTSGSGGHPHDASGAIIGNEAIRTMVRGLGVELAPSRRVNAVAPTWTPTPLWRHLNPEQLEGSRASFAGRIPLGRTAEVREVAAAYLFLMSNAFITGQTLTLDGGLTLVE
nr:SDR family oxidoreductase [uncultured Holophaga sp.]